MEACLTPLWESPLIARFPVLTLEDEPWGSVGDMSGRRPVRQPATCPLGHGRRVEILRSCMKWASRLGWSGLRCRTGGRRRGAPRLEGRIKYDVVVCEWLCPLISCGLHKLERAHEPDPPYMAPTRYSDPTCDNGPDEKVAQRPDPTRTSKAIYIYTMQL